jgi:hypothetical protein
VEVQGPVAASAAAVAVAVVAVLAVAVAVVAAAVVVAEVVDTGTVETSTSFSNRRLPDHPNWRLRYKFSPRRLFCGFKEISSFATRFGINKGPPKNVVTDLFD